MVFQKATSFLPIVLPYPRRKGMNTKRWKAKLEKFRQLAYRTSDGRLVYSKDVFPFILNFTWAEGELKFMATDGYGAPRTWLTIKSWSLHKQAKKLAVHYPELVF
jgi:hypothetical protein